MLETSKDRDKWSDSQTNPCASRARTSLAMSNGTNFDPEPLQTLFASASMVQGSGMEPQVLARIMEIEESIEAHDFDLNGILEVIAEQVRKLSRADGVAIALLRKGQLMYGAGCGSAASYVGRSVAATLSTSGSQEMTSEILRVENADNDPRIQAAICRQFGAKSLLILPVRSNGSLSAVLQIMFEEAHFFSDQEIRTYWVFSGLTGDAIRSSWHAPVRHTLPADTIIRHEFVKAPSIPAALPVAQPAAEAIANAALTQASEVASAAPSYNAEPISKTEPALEPEPVLHTEPLSTLQPVLQAVPSPMADPLPIVAPLLSAGPQAKIIRALWLPIQAFSYLKDAWDVGVAAAIVVALFTLVFYRERPSAMIPAAKSVTDKATAVSTPLPSAIVKPAVDTAESMPVPRRVPRGSQKLAYSSNVRVRHFGDDVTVRYFAPQSVMVRTNTTESGVHRFSDDVTVRYFKPRDTADQTSQ